MRGFFFVYIRIVLIIIYWYLVEKTHRFMLKIMKCLYTIFIVGVCLASCKSDDCKKKVTECVLKFINEINK